MRLVSTCIDRRRLLALVAALPCARAAHAAETTLPKAEALADEARAAAERGEALVLLISLPGCPYCERVRRSHLLPLAREHASAVQIDLGSGSPVLDFEGASTTHDTLAARLHARFAPTVLFLDSAGRELAERLVGAGSPDFYGAFLEQRLETARTALSRR